MRDPRRSSLARLSIALATTLLASSAAVAATPDNFKAATTADMIALCATDPAAPDYASAIAFCHGFAVGAYQYYQSVAGGDPAERFVCLPNPPPARSQAIADFVAWTRTHTEALNAAPVESMFRYLGDRYPCAK